MIDDLWYKNAIVYCLDVETFMDSNRDGIGDFEGLERRMDDLAGLGVTCVWLLPFHPSPNRDNGYDITDYYGVDPRFGSLGDFVEFTHHARKHGIRVIMDLVVNLADQRRDPSSLLNWTERLIRMRKETPEVGWGSYRVLRTRLKSVLALAYEWRGNCVVTVHNLEARAQEVTFEVDDPEPHLTNLLTHQHSVADQSGKHRIELEPFGYRWLRLGGMVDLQTRKPR